MIFKQLFDKKSSTYTYIVSSGKGREALIIDPVIENTDEYINVLKNLDLKFVKVIDIINKLLALGSEIRILPVPGDWSGMFWRFAAIDDHDVEVMLSRDTDSRLTLREKAAVDDWLSSGKLFHVMRDHP